VAVETVRLRGIWSSISPDATASPSDVASTSGPEELVRGYFEAQNVADLTGDTRELSDLSHDKCVTCRSTIHTVEQLYSAGGSIDYTGQAVSRIRIVEESPRRATVRFRVSYPAGTRVPSEDEEPVAFEGRDEPYEADVRLVDGKWLMRELLVIKP
jgi:hypothetical protein